MEASARDREILRELASVYMEYASLPVQKEKIALWRALNRGEMQRPMVMIDQLPWNELNVNDELTLRVEDPFWRGIEDGLRKRIYQWRHFPVDLVLDPYIVIPKAIRRTDYGLQPEKETLNYDKTSDVDAQHFTNLIHTEEDVAKIKDIQITHDEKESARRLQEAEAIFQGVAPVRLSGGTLFHVGVWDF